MGVERLEGETPRFRIAPDALQRAQFIAKRNQMRALRAVGPEGCGGKQNGAAGVTGIGGLLQRTEETGRRQILQARTSPPDAVTQSRIAFETQGLSQWFSHPMGIVQKTIHIQLLCSVRFGTIWAVILCGLVQ